MQPASSLRWRLLTTASALSAFFVPCLAGVANAGGALPSGGQFVAGKGSLGSHGASLTIDQFSTTGIIDWNGFSIGKGNAVTFNNGSGATLNEVTGNNLSTIAGSLHASGSVYLINRNGIIISGTGRVVTGGSFVASTAGPDGQQRGNIVDAGSIKSGSASLAAQNVSVPGSVAVMRGGRLWLVSSGTTAISGKVNAQTANGSGGAVTVRGADIDVSGQVNASATQAGKSGGSVSIVASNTDKVTGAINAAGGAKGQGGSIETSGRVLSIDGSKIDAGAGGHWLLDPYDLTVTSSAASTIDTSLNDGTSVTLKTTATGTSGPGTSNPSGNGDIFIDSALTWSTTATLTLDAYHSIYVDAPITVTGAGQAVLTTNDGGSNGDYSFDLGPTGFGGSLSFTGTPNSGQALTINGTPYTLLYSMSDVQNINASNTTLAGDYALANSLDASGTSSWIPIGTDGNGNTSNSGGGFTGSFEGLGHTISNLTINLPSVELVGLFGVSSGTTRDIGMLGGAMNGLAGVGELAGSNNGTIANSYATGADTGVSGGGGGGIGGLVGGNGGTISNSYATGAVAGDLGVGGLVGSNEFRITNSYATGAVSGSNEWIGGLVGLNEHIITGSYATGAVTGGNNSEGVGGLIGSTVSPPHNSPLVTNSFATGAVSGGGGVGGLVGEIESTTIEDSYSTGAVSGQSSVGGLVGYKIQSGTTNSYWDTQTSGQSSSDGGRGLTTAQLQAALPTGFSNGIWGTGMGLFPYFLWQYPSSPPQVISGIAYMDGGATPLASTAAGAAFVSALMNGTSLGSVSTGANGYYYYALAPGTISGGGSALLVYTAQDSTTGASNAATLENATGSLENFNIWGNTLIAPTGDTTYSSASATSLQTQDASLISTAVGSNTTVQSLVAGLSEFGYIATGSGFTIDEALSPSNGLYAQTTAGNLAIADSVTTSGGIVDLVSAGALSESGAGVISTTTLTGSSAGATTLNAANAIGDLDGFSTQNGSFSLTDAGALTVNGAVDAGTGNLTLTTTGSASNLTLDSPLTGATVDLVSGGTTTEHGFGIISAAKLTGSSAGAATLLDPNMIAALGTFTSGGGFALTDAQSLTVDGALSATGCCADLMTTGAGSNLTIDAPITDPGHTVSLNSAGTISQSSADIITAEGLAGSSSGAVTLEAPNAIGVLFAFTSGGSFSLANAQSLTVDGALSVTGCCTKLMTTGAGSNLTIDAAITDIGHTVSLESAGTIGQSSAGIITAGGLAGSSSGAVTLEAANAIADLHAFTSHGSFALTDAQSLVVDGAVVVTGCCGELATTGTGDNLTIAAALSDPGHTITLNSAGTITQGSAGVITAGGLTGTSAGAVTLEAANAIEDLHAFASGGAFVLVDAAGLTVDGAVTATGCCAELTTTGAGDDLTIDDAITDSGHTLTLASAGTIASDSAGILTAAALAGSSSGAVTLTADNAIPTLDAFGTGNGAFSLSDTDALAVIGAIDAGSGNVTFTTTGSGSNLALDAMVTGNTVDLTSGGNVTEASYGGLTASLLNVTADTGITLTSSNNDITTVGTDMTSSGPNTIDQH